MGTLNSLFLTDLLFSVIAFLSDLLLSVELSLLLVSTFLSDLLLSVELLFLLESLESHDLLDLLDSLVLDPPFSLLYFTLTTDPDLDSEFESLSDIDVGVVVSP